MHPNSLNLGRKFGLDLLRTYFLRGIVKLLVFPLSFVPESSLKQRVRRWVLHLQNSLPIELSSSQGQVVVQVGTPRPRTLRRFREAVGPEGRVVVVEAEPKNCQRLRDFIAARGYENVLLLEGAAWIETKSGTLAVSPYDGDHKIAKDDIQVDNDLRDGNASMRSIPCEFFRLDELLPQHGIEAVDYLSVTVNGAELDVLRGAEGLFNYPATRIYAKGHCLDARGEPLNVGIRAYLNQLGFRTMKTRGEPSAVAGGNWKRRDGDVYAWRDL